MAEPKINLEAGREIAGRAQLIGKNGSLYVSRGYSVYRSDDHGATWLFDCGVPQRGWKPAAAQLPLAARLLRYNIQALQTLPDGTRVAVAHDGIYRANPGETEMKRTWQVTRGSRPITLSVDGNRVLFGEYGLLDHVGVRIYCSDDGGRNFESVYEFAVGDIHHLHAIVVDPHVGNYWVLAGDHGCTPGIATLSKDFRSFDWIDRGNQMVRAVSVICRPDCLIYGSDTELEQNYLVRLDKQTGRHEKLMPVDGSSLYAAEIGGVTLVSTCVEPSKVNHGAFADLYASSDGVTWGKVRSFRKDIWHAQLFQFGLIVLPNVEIGAPSQGMFSGQALKNNHDRTSLFSVSRI